MNEFFTKSYSEYKFIKNSNHAKDTIYNHQEPEYCYIEILELKNEADQLLLKYGIPLELNLSHKSWYDIDNDYPTDNELNAMKEASNECILYLLKYEGFVENNNFAKPEHEEYGLVLGIIKDIHLSLSLVGDFEPV